MIFEWDEKKEISNIIKHGISFKAAEQIFYDPRRMERLDEDENDYEERWQTMGMFDKVLFVVYTEREDVTHIISARKAEPFERRIYHGNRETHGWHRANP